MQAPAASADPPVSWALLPTRSALIAEGADAVRFLDNFTTASLAPLAVGTGTEGIFADGRGQVLALATLLRTPNGIWVDAAPGLTGRLLEHLEHYHIREAVSFRDAAADQATFLILGSQATGWLARQTGVPLPMDGVAHRSARLGDIPLTLVSTDWFGPGGYLLVTHATEAERLADWLAATGVGQMPDAAVDAARIDAGSPEPHDIPPKTLPQELGRDARAICFTKGCYLGQETVARLDALGHVNRRLVGVAMAGAAPPDVGADIMLDGAAVGTVTSACVSPTLGTGLGLALMHVRALAADASPVIGGSPVRIVSLPVRPTAAEPVP